ncbi:MAG: amidase family protein, partial [Solirubrobacterales bacterium]|nr:amidase family protein [Solirubrobacterales bacterium]
MSDRELVGLSASAAIAAVRAGELDSHELFATYRRRALEHGTRAPGQLNCSTWIAEDAPGDSPDGAPPAGLALAGLPLAVKDLFCTEGVPSQAGSRMLEGYRPPYTATAVARLQDAGARLLTKTNQDEFAMGSSTEHSAFGPTLNPWGL